MRDLVLMSGSDFDQRYTQWKQRGDSTIKRRSVSKTTAKTRYIEEEPQYTQRHEPAEPQAIHQWVFLGIGWRSASKMSGLQDRPSCVFASRHYSSCGCSPAEPHYASCRAAKLYRFLQNTKFRLKSQPAKCPIRLIFFSSGRKDMRNYARQSGGRGAKRRRG